MARCTAPVHGHRTASGRAVERPALHAVAVAVIAVMAATGRTRPRLILRRGAALAYPAAAQGRNGREPVRPWRTQLQRCGHSRRSAKTSKGERLCLTFGTSFCAMRGTTGQGPPRTCTTCSSHAVFRSGSARRTSPLARRCSAKLTGDWRSHESGSCW